MIYVEQRLPIHKCFAATSQNYIMSSTTPSSHSTAPCRTLVESQTYMDYIKRQSCLAARDPEQLAEDLCRYTLTEIPRVRQWGRDPVLLTMLYNAHIGIPSDPDDPTSPLIYPEGPAMVYRFMQSPDGEIDADWDSSGHYLSPGNNADKPPWGMKDVPDSIVMKAAAKASLEIRTWWRPVVCDGTSLDFMEQMTNNLESGTRFASRMFLHVMASELGAYQEYLTNKAMSKAVADNGPNNDTYESRQKMNEFFHALDVMTLRRSTSSSPYRAPHAAICSEDFVSLVVPHYHERWDGFEGDEQADDRSFYQSLIALDPRYSSIPALERVLNRATEPAAEETELDAGAKEAEAERRAPFDYVGRYKTMKEGSGMKGPTENDVSARITKLSQLASKLRSADQARNESDESVEV